MLRLLFFSWMEESIELFLLELALFSQPRVGCYAERFTRFISFNLQGCTRKLVLFNAPFMEEEIEAQGG